MDMEQLPFQKVTYLFKKSNSPKKRVFGVKWHICDDLNFNAKITFGTKVCLKISRTVILNVALC